jgi:hypothetical protein
VDPVAAQPGAALDDDVGRDRTRRVYNRWFSKRNATNRIDPLVALTMGVGKAAAGDLGSVYSERGLLIS